MDEESAGTTTFGTTTTNNIITSTPTIMKDKDPILLSPSSTDGSTSQAITITPAINKLPPAVVPPKMKCAECPAEKVSQEMWWCRTCLKTICIQCNLLKGHTEHRSSPWSLQEVAQSLVTAVEIRRAVRHQRAADEEIAIREFMVEVENYFLTKLNNLLQEKNDDDKRLMSNVCESLRYDPKLALPSTDSSPSRSTQPLLALHGLEDSKLEKILQEVKKLTNVECPLPDGGGSSRPQTPTLHGRKRSFGVLPDMSPEEFARMLEEKLSEEGWTRRARANSVDLVLRSGTPIELVYETTSSASQPQSRTSPLPVEPKVTVVNGVTFNKMINGHNSSVDGYQPPKH